MSNTVNDMEKFVNYCTKDTGETPLLVSSWFGYYDICVLLLNYGANINHMDNYGGTALMNSAERGFYNISKLLVDHGADVNVHNTAYGWSPLLYSCKHGFYNIAKIFIHAGANIFHEDHLGLNAFIVSSTEGHVSILLVLLDVLKQIREKKYIKHKQLQLAHHQQQQQQEEGVVIVKESNQQPSLSPTSKHNRSSKDQTQSLTFLHTSLCKTILRNYTMCSNLLIKNMPIELLNQADENGFTPLIMATYTGQLNIVNELLKYPIDINKKGLDEFTALMWACKKVIIKYVKNYYKFHL